ncbi:hypothetical protein JOQ06_011627, partial [Pogonophryne albipinna]
CPGADSLCVIPEVYRGDLGNWNSSGLIPQMSHDPFDGPLSAPLYLPITFRQRTRSPPLVEPLLSVWAGAWASAHSRYLHSRTKPLRPAGAEVTAEGGVGFLVFRQQESDPLFPSRLHTVCPAPAMFIVQGQQNAAYHYNKINTYPG